MARRRISPERKGLYYTGLAITLAGLVTFLSSFFVLIGSFGETHFDTAMARGKSFATRGIAGMVLLVVGGLLTRVGSVGVAGSGLKLDPEAARRDLEPWSRMAGGTVKDALDEAGLGPGVPALPFDERLRRLEQLRKDGLVNEAEYEAARQRILASA